MKARLLSQGGNRHMILVFAWFCVCMVLVFATEPAMHVAQTLLEINLLPGVAGHKHDVTALTMLCKIFYPQQYIIK